MANPNPLAEVLAQLAAVVNGRPPDAELLRRIDDKLKEDGLERPDTVAQWVIDLLSAIRDRRPTDGWVPFKMRGVSDSRVMDLIQELPELLPVEFHNEEERWRLLFPSIGMEAHISFEGYLYIVVRMGDPTP